MSPSIGTGVAGLTAAWLLNKRYDVTLSEKNDYAGGHTRTIPIAEGDDKGTPIDTGFIVYNERNYPLFTKLLRKLHVPTADSDMSFSYTCEETGYTYAGSDLRTLFAQPRNLFHRYHWRMIVDIVRFNKQALRDLEQHRFRDETLSDYLERYRYSPSFTRNYLCYVQAITDSLKRPVYLNTSIRSLEREASRVIVRDTHGGRQHYDNVVIATHADEALSFLDEPTPEEERLLGAWSYQENEATLHTDQSLMPRPPRAWASWNFGRRREPMDDDPVSVTYHMNRLQALTTKQSYFVTLNGVADIDQNRILDRHVFTHPVYDFDAVKTQSRLHVLNGIQNTYYCGSYFGYGFHEDAVRSAVDVASSFGVSLDET